MLVIISTCSLLLAIGCCLLIASDLVCRARQHLGITYAVWPLTALWAGPLAVVPYGLYGRAPPASAPDHHRMHPDHGHPAQRRGFSARDTTLATLHCGAACLLGDCCAEGMTAVAPWLLVGHVRFGTWAYGFPAAYILRMIFQYATFVPMRHLGLRAGIPAIRPSPTPSLPVYWFMMQIAMVGGFGVSFPANAWLLHRGITKRM